MTKHIEGKIRKACDLYGMIDAGDCIAIGVSGGKDSLALLVGLARLRKYYKKEFSLVALTLDPCFDGVPGNYEGITSLCSDYGIPHYVKRTNLAEILFEIRREKNPCSLCARMRRGSLHDLCLRYSCNKIALGHHLDDAVETFFLNLYHEGRLSAFAPVTYLSRKNLTMVRPLILCSEQEIFSAVSRCALPVVKSRCPVDGATQRQHIKAFVRQKETEYPGFLHRTFTAMQNADVSNLKP